MVDANKKAIIYDMDNTLVASNLFVLQHIIETIQGSKYEDLINEEDIKKVLAKNLSFSDIFLELFGEDCEKILTNYRETASYKNYFQTLGAVNFVNKIAKKGIIQGIVTNRIKMADKRLKQAGFMDFNFIFEPLSKEQAKPNPECFMQALKLLKNKGIDTQQIIVIGDHIDDYLAAKGAGLDFCAVLTGSVLKEDFMNLGLKENKIFNSLEELNETSLF